MINVAGHRMGTAEVESALVSHPKVSEAAVVGYPHAVKGQGIELRDWVKGDRPDCLDDDFTEKIGGGDGYAHLCADIHPLHS